MTARARIGGYGYRPSPIYTGPSDSLRGRKSPDGLSSRVVGGVIYKTRTRRVHIGIPT